MRDLLFLSGQFQETEIPKEQLYLLKYFKTEMQIAFLRYYLVFKETSCFREHTGHTCTSAYLWKVEHKFKTLTEEHRIAKKNMDFEKVWLIESGNWTLQKKAD